MTSGQALSARDQAISAQTVGAGRQFRSLLAAAWAGKNRGLLLLLVIGVVGVIVATAFGQIRLNAWNRPFYDAIMRKNAATFLEQLLVFALIATGLLTLNVLQGWLQQMIKL